MCNCMSTSYPENIAGMTRPLHLSTADFISIDSDYNIVQQNESTDEKGVKLVNKTVDLTLTPAIIHRSDVLKD
jgi:hypothetical protein